MKRFLFCRFWKRSASFSRELGAQNRAGGGKRSLYWLGKTNNGPGPRVISKIPKRFIQNSFFSGKRFLIPTGRSASV